MIERLSVRNFKVLREIDLELKPLTVIVGPNGSGKTTILQALSLTTDCASLVKKNSNSRQLSQAFLRRHYPILQSRNPSLDIVLRASGYRGLQEKPFDLEMLIGTEVDIKGTGEPSTFSPAFFLDLSIDQLAAPSDLGEARTTLPTDGEGLAAILAGLSLEEPEKFRRLVDHLKNIVPSVLNIRFRRVPLESSETGVELFFDIDGADLAIPAQAVSAGTLLSLGLLTAITIVNQNEHLILIDELERGLHPRALKEFIGQIRSLQNQSEGLQIVATSHSPYLVDYLQADEVLLTALDSEGIATVMPLTAHPDYERWKNLMAPGEFWSTVGEDWITKESKANAQ